MSGYKVVDKNKAVLRKKITQKEREFAECIELKGLSSIEAARKTFGWRCGTNTAEARRAKDLSRAPRVKEYRQKLQKQEQNEADANSLFTDTSKIQWDKIRKFAYDKLVDLRDDPRKPSNSRWKATQALEKLADPTADVNLIYMWLDLLWRGSNVHCPCCHKTFPLKEIKNPKLQDFRKEVNLPEVREVETIFEQRNEILRRADTRKKPHEAQVIALSAPERHVVGLGAARAGKSLLLAYFGLLGFLIPGAEVWILAETYKRASSEVEYLERFLNTLFYPYKDHIIRKVYEAKTEELTLTSRWGSILKVKSAKAKGSITGRELEMALVAEPGWVPEDIFEELRARMSSRLGRIIMLGTPKGFGGILGRMVNLTGRDPKTRKIIRIPPEERTIEAGCDWGISLLKYNLHPQQNPEYVKSELSSARMELTDAEYASEFEGLMTTEEGALFAQIKPYHLARIPRDIYENCIWVLGIDQGPKNFAGCLIGFDGKKVIVAKEYFENDNRLMLNHMEELKNSTPAWIQSLGGNPDYWNLTIFDVDPSIYNELDHFDEIGSPWPTEVTFRPKNKTGTGYTQENWRKETYEYVNTLASENNLMFDIEEGDQLHDQLLRALIKPESRDTDSPKRSDKGWIINDPWRGDHVVDAFVLSLYTILSGQLLIPDVLPQAGDSWSEAKAAFDYKVAAEERRELAGYDGKTTSSDEIFEKKFGRERRRNASVNVANYSYYNDA